MRWPIKPPLCACRSPAVIVAILMTAISAAIGFSKAAALRGEDRHTLAILGDGAATGGMAYEAINNAVNHAGRLLVILNDNQMSIGHNEGGLASYFARIWASSSTTPRQTCCRPYSLSGRLR